MGRRSGVKKKPYHWDPIHQYHFDKIKEVITCETLLAYPNYDPSVGFDIHTDASTRQLGAVISQNQRPIAFFSRKLTEAQTKYSVTELELLSIVECLKEFKGMLWGQTIRVYTDHKNLQADALNMTSDRVYRWRLILEEYGPEIIYIKGETNIVADTLSRLEYDPGTNVREISYNKKSIYMVKMMNHYIESTKKVEVTMASGTYSQMKQMAPVATFVQCHSYVSERRSDVANVNYTNVFANWNSSDELQVYPVTIKVIAEEQRKGKYLKAYFRKK